MTSRRTAEHARAAAWSVRRSASPSARAAPVLALAVLLAVAAPARAADLPLDGVVALGKRLADQAVAAPDAPLRRTYASLARRVQKPSVTLGAEVAKIQAVSKALAGRLGDDGALYLLVGRAADDADGALAEFPDAISVGAGRLARASDLRRVEKAALSAYAAHQQGRDVRDAIDERAALAKFVRAARAYEAATLLAERRARRRGGARSSTVAAEPGRVYTVAGTGAGGFNGDGHEARRSSLYFVDEVRFGPDGLLYVLDWNNHMLRRIETDGTVSRVCGSGTPGDTEGPAFETQLNHPSALAFEPDGRIWIAAWHNHKVKLYDPRGAAPVVVTVAGGNAGKGGDEGPATDARFNLLPGVLRLPDGDLLVTDATNQVVRRVCIATDPVTDVNVAGVTVATGIVHHVAGTTGVAGHDGDGGPAADAVLAFSKSQNAEPDGRMELDPSGQFVYVVCGVGNCIRKIDLSDGTISTFAGSGVAGYTGDDGAAVFATFDLPSDVAVAGDGTVFVSDANNHAIRRIAPDGTVSTYAGGGGPGVPADGVARADARFHRPAGLELDAHGNLWVCDRLNHVVRVITSADPGGLQVPVAPYVLPLPPRGKPPAKGASGTIDTFAGSGVLGFNGDGRPALDTQLYWPQDVAVDPVHGLVTFCDWNNHRIRRVEDDGTIRTVVGSGYLGSTEGPALTVSLNHPTDLAFHPLTGELWIAGWHTDKILRVDATTNDAVYMAGSVRGIDPANEGGPSRAAVLNLPSSVKFDAAGNWYVGDEGNRRVAFVDAARDEFRTLAGGGLSTGDGLALDADLDLPVGQAAQPGGRVALSPDGRFLYLAETSGNRVRRIDLAASPPTISTLAGSGIAGYMGDGGDARFAMFRAPVDVDCDAAGNVYIVDRDNHAVRRVDVATGTISTVAGDGSPGDSGDRGAATSARLCYPGGIHVDRATGRLWIADTYNGVIRVVWE